MKNFKKNGFGLLVASAFMLVGGAVQAADTPLTDTYHANGKTFHLDPSYASNKQADVGEISEAEWRAGFTTPSSSYSNASCSGSRCSVPRNAGVVRISFNFNGAPRQVTASLPRGGSALVFKGSYTTTSQQPVRHWEGGTSSSGYSTCTHDSHGGTHCSTSGGGSTAGHWEIHGTKSVETSHYGTITIDSSGRITSSGVSGLRASSANL